MGDESDFGDSIFDDADEAELAALERPTKRQKTSLPAVVDHLALAERILTTNFGYKSFRHEQAGVIKSLLAGDNALAVFPTGAGKSLCYQVSSHPRQLINSQAVIADTVGRFPQLRFRN